MLHFSDQPYRFFPPKPSWGVRFVLGQFNRRHHLPLTLRIRRVEATCPQTVLDGWRQGKRILFTPNHPSHSDPAAMFEAQRQFRIPSMFMAAYDAFFLGKRRRWMLQRAGVFSVDRETSDKQSLKQGIQTLVEGKFALTIFPEGNVHLQNDRVTPFNEGAFYIAWKALQELKKTEPEGDILICPVSLKFTHTKDVRSQLLAMLKQGAAAVDTEYDASRPTVEEVRRIGVEGLRKTLRQRGIRLPTDPGVPLPQLIQSADESLIQSLEDKIGIQTRATDSLVDRVRRIRREIHRIRTDAGREAEHEVASAWAIEAMTALRILSYSGQYLDHPTLDRVAETVEKLIEDIYSKMGEPYSERCAYVRVAKPISLSAYLGNYPDHSREAIHPLTRECETEVQKGIDLINATNPHSGGEPFQQASL